jgi:biopolymer transport protein ExbD
MKKYLISALLALGLCAGLFAGESKDYPQISFVLPSTTGTTVPRDQLVTVVVEPGFLSHEETPIPADSVAGYINDILKAKNASYVGVYVRQGVKYGELVKALDQLRLSDAKSIGVSMTELPPGKQP